jgi:hypothetical protein
LEKRRRRRLRISVALCRTYASIAPGPLHGLSHAKLIRLPSFAESDEYETSLRYASEPVAHLYAHDTQGRIVGDEWIYFLA